MCNDREAEWAATHEGWGTEKQHHKRAELKYNSSWAFVFCPSLHHECPSESKFTPRITGYCRNTYWGSPRPARKHYTLVCTELLLPHLTCSWEVQLFYSKVAKMPQGYTATCFFLGDWLQIITLFFIPSTSSPSHINCSIWCKRGGNSLH